ncbi:hypothetical protein TIFTF001_042546 [Ficus carica]|uniref:Uncharacterized protein n=1 Tax=Ficus carica TaxID=3494 RepID=A0AA87ZMZ9_FICCA|nr:hypothetical protein TIFTF001_042543 [Ficus carica]GMN36967.1 hypothetical protein TIFTF001_042546 [Ficus carica]
MSGEDNSLNVDDTERPHETTSSRANTSQYGQTGDKQLLDELEAVKINIRDTQEEKTCDDIKIKKTPEIMLRNGDLNEYFRPRELSIGPIHAADSNLFKKELKLKLAAHFIEATGIKVDDLLEEFKREIKVIVTYIDIEKQKHTRKIKAIKTYFDKEVIKSFNDEEELIRLVFLDGCAMLEFIYGYVNQRLNLFDISNGQAALIQQDMFLLENQIPFRVLEVLMGLGKRGTRAWEDDFLRFIRTSNIIVPDDSWKAIDMILLRRELYKKPAHILDLNRRMLCIGSEYEIQQFLQRLTCCYIFFFLYVLTLVCCVMNCFNKSDDDPSDYRSTKQTFRNVQELKAAGIMFKPSRSLETILFHSRFTITGQLKLPTLVVDDTTARKFFNLVAFEMCLPTNKETKYWVTSYINLLDLLIDNEQDVKDLRTADTLRNGLSSDVQVAQLINLIGSKCFAPPKDAYGDVKNDIEKHYKRRCAIWMAQACHGHFNSPWTILALFAATTELVLTANQTWFAVNPKN